MGSSSTSTSLPGTLMMVPRWSGSRVLIRTRTGWGRLIADCELTVMEAEKVPFLLANALGLILTLTVAGVPPDEGVMVIPGELAVSVKSVAAPLGSEIVKVSVDVRRAQKAPENTMSSTETLSPPS